MSIRPGGSNELLVIAGPLSIEAGIRTTQQLDTAGHAADFIPFVGSETSGSYIDTLRIDYFANRPVDGLVIENFEPLALTSSEHPGLAAWRGMQIGVATLARCARRQIFYTHDFAGETGTGMLAHVRQGTVAALQGMGAVMLSKSGLLPTPGGAEVTT